jgi:predicted GNAT family N-acyltransferase
VDSYSVTFVDSPAAMDAALDIRRRVFIEEQGVPEDLEIDEHDGPEAWGKSAVHALLAAGAVPIATGRLLLEEGPAHNAHVGRVAVLAEHRKRGAGSVLMRALEDRARALGYPGVTLAAQLHAVGFYERLGYTVRDDVFLDAGIEHRWMDLQFG